MTRTIEIKDWADKNTVFILTADNKALGRVHQFAPKEWQAFDADGNFIDWFRSKAKAKAALA